MEGGSAFGIGIDELPGVRIGPAPPCDPQGGATLRNIWHGSVLLLPESSLSVRWRPRRFFPGWPLKSQAEPVCAGSAGAGTRVARSGSAMEICSFRPLASAGKRVENREHQQG